MPFITQPSFTAGELAPSLQARIDLAKYAVGVETMKNFFCHTHGGVSNRPGSYMIKEVKDSSTVHRLIPFVVNSESAFALEFGNTSLRFFAEVDDVHGSVILNLVDSGVFKWTLSGFGTSEYYLELDAGGDPGIMEVLNVIEDDAYMVEGLVSVLAVGEWAWGDSDSLGYNTVYVRLNAVSDPDAYQDGYVYTEIEIRTPYNTADLVDLNYVQSADVMYLVHPNYYPQKLSRFSNTYWTIEDISITDGPYKSTEPSDVDIILTPEERDGDDIAITSNNAFFDSKHIGSSLRLGYINPLDATDIHWGIGVIDQVTDSTNARIDITEPLGYEQVFNSKFELGLVGYEDKSVAPGSIKYKSDTKTINFVSGGGANIADMRQELEMTANVKVTLSLNIVQFLGATVFLRVSVGTTSGASDVAGPTSYSTEGIHTLEFTPDQTEIHITVDNTGSNLATTGKLGELSVTNSELATPEWRIEAFNDTDGYPRAVGIHEQRLCLGGTPKYPMTQWHSKTGGFEDFGFNSPLEDSDAFSYRFDSGKVVDINWIVSLEKMIVGTSESEWGVKPGSTSDVITPSSVNAKAESYNGCANIMPLVVGNSIVYVRRGAGAIDEYAYSLESDGYVGSDRSIMANHLFENYNILEWTYSKLPYSIIWAVRNDGKLLGLTYLKEHEVWGWHRHETDGEYESICSIPGSNVDWVYAIVKRTINGSTKRFIEVFMPRINDADLYDYFFVDCGLTYDGGDDLVTDGSIEEWTGDTPDNWNKFVDGTSTITKEVVGVHSGAASAKCSIDSIGSGVVLWQNESYVEGYTYRAIVWLYGDGSGSIRIVDDPAAQGGLHELVTPPAAWTKYEFDFIANDVSTVIRILRGNPDDVSWDYYIDDVQVIELSTAIVKGLDHLEGKDVAVIADGSVVPGKTITNGEIVIPTPANLIHVGLPFTSDLGLLGVAIADPLGSSQGRTKSIPSVKIRFENTRAALVGPDADHLDEMRFREDAEGEDPIALVTGDRGVTFNSGYDTDGKLFIRNTDPVPITVLSVTPDVEISER